MKENKKVIFQDHDALLSLSLSLSFFLETVNYEEGCSGPNPIKLTKYFM